VSKIHHKKSNIIPHIGNWVPSIVLSFHPLTLENDNKGMDWAIVKFQYIFEYPYVIHRNICSIMSWHIKHRNNPIITSLQQSTFWVFHSIMVPISFHFGVLNCYYENLLHNYTLSKFFGLFGSIRCPCTTGFTHLAKGGIYGLEACSNSHLLQKQCKKW